MVQAVEAVNDFYKGSGKNLLLMTPGRVGTSSPELGVPVSFRSISNFSAVCEVSDSRAGYMPELSYGSHMFQDLVEAQILYGAVYNDRRTLAYHAELFGDIPDRFLPGLPGTCGYASGAGGHRPVFLAGRCLQPRHLRVRKINEQSS